MFSTRDGFAFFFSNQPGSYVAMFGPDGKKLSFRLDKCYLDDGAKSYTWAFEYPGEVKEGDTWMFVTGERAVVGETKDGVIHIVSESTRVTRDEIGRPERVLIMPGDKTEDKKNV